MCARTEPLRVGIIGFGTVGRGVWSVLSKVSTNVDVVAICVKNPDKHPDINPKLLRKSVNEILADQRIDVVLELTNNVDDAYAIVTSALREGKAVVTASKALIAAHLPELIEIQKETKQQVLYEASVCAGIPIIRSLEEYYDNDLLESVNGIVNGSTNYILSLLASGGVEFSEALRLAQDKGFAETDPWMDVSGSDARSKLVILCAHAFGVYVRPASIPTIGISSLGPADFAFADEHRWKIKLIAQARKNEDGSIRAMVTPKFVDKSDRLFDVDDVYNGIVTTMAFSETQFFVGRGAGALPTASAVISDLSALSYRYRYEYKKAGTVFKTVESADSDHTIYVRFATSDEDLIVPQMEDLDQFHKARNESYVIGRSSSKTIEKIARVAKSLVLI